MSTFDAVDFVHAGRITPRMKWSLAAHFHPFNEIVVIVRGTQKVAIRNQVVSATVGEMLFFPSGVDHEEWIEDDVPFESMYLAFQWKGYKKNYPVHTQDCKGRMYELLSWLLAEQFGYFDGAVEYRQTFLRAAIAEYVRLASHTEHELVEDVRAYIHAHLSESFTIEDLAASAAMSKYHFIRLYKTLTGMTPMEDVRRIRIETARHLVLLSDMPLKAIAPRVGYADEYHLSRLLKQHLGIGARELRRNTRG